jgi:hypothetical protein
VTVTQRIILAIALFLGLAGASLAAAGLSAATAAACENHTS